MREIFFYVSILCTIALVYFSFGTSKSMRHKPQLEGYSNAVPV
ncbi:hypothetical protein [Flavobacterium cellulosilyticum]|nr:hypothetical protein [Flavobacterium cellulosilyticum]